MKRLAWLFALTIPVLMSGCRTGVILQETPLGVSETRVAIVTVIGEPRLVSPDGRELYSKFYDKKGNLIGRLEMATERYYTLVSILGDRRPYDLQVEVIIEDRGEDGKFMFFDKDEAKARPIAEKIKKALNQSLGNRNVIDDFRSF